ncbi:hypothetical protein PUN28_000307 [Cardiocondyla obscurior]|uniref:Uncharacterized protein n=1 Tax=Cardiocondyla obscurior TaxID=286306 RepID=A0AAW2GZ49_9HYME
MSLNEDCVNNLKSLALYLMKEVFLVIILCLRSKYIEKVASHIAFSTFK